ncbi:MAG: hypothetical protein HOD60_12300 [Candidatus Nitrosopelagicus sp.]|jgi:hypothetical protein|nr:hypothetical protein [Candidatus Nitrosopelagicus sp.]
MRNNRNDAFVKIEKNAESLESYRDFPLIFIMKDMVIENEYYSEMYVGILDCVEGHRIYLKDTFEIDEGNSRYLGNEFKKWDLTREDSTINEFPHIKLEFIDSIYASKLKLTLEQAWNAWSDPRDIVKTQTYQKIQEIFNSIMKTFTEKSKPVFLDDNGSKLSLKEIYEIESINEKPISLIAVTRHQYDINEFPKYEKYVKEYGNKRFYYGLWPDEKENKVEYDILYAIPTSDNEEVQRHLNSHNHMNQGNSQSMALVIFSNGDSEIIKNSKM